MRNIFDRHFWLYILIGLWGAVVDFGSFFILDSVFEVNYLAANTVSSCLGIFNNFVMNYKFNFKVNDNFARRCAVFFAIGLSGIVVSNFILLGLIGYLGLNSLLAKFIALGIVVAAQYTVNRFFTFRVKQQQ